MRRSSCPIPRSPRARAAANKRTAAIRDRFPPGLSQPALRALDGAGLRQLADLASVSEAELGALHGMGPKALRLLRAALQERGLVFAR
jgi:hypothetical protein